MIDVYSWPTSNGHWLTPPRSTRMRSCPPIRTCSEPSPPPPTEPPPVPRSTRPFDTSAYGSPIPENADRIEYWVRFLSGCVAGVFLSLDVAAVFFDAEVFTSRWKQMALLFSAVMLLCGWGAARYGDKFWHTIFRRRWFWP